MAITALAAHRRACDLLRSRLMSARKLLRSLQFESLETRASLTSVATAGVDAAEELPGEFARTDLAPSHQILRFVATLGDIHLERTVPTLRESETADQWLSSASPSQYETDEPPGS